MAALNELGAVIVKAVDGRSFFDGYRVMNNSSVQLINSDTTMLVKLNTCDFVRDTLFNEMRNYTKTNQFGGSFINISDFPAFYDINPSTDGFMRVPMLSNSGRVYVNFATINSGLDIKFRFCGQNNGDYGPWYNLANGDVPASNTFVINGFEIQTFYIDIKFNLATAKKIYCCKLPLVPIITCVGLNASDCPGGCDCSNIVCGSTTGGTSTPTSSTGGTSTPTSSTSSTNVTGSLVSTPTSATSTPTSTPTSDSDSLSSGAIAGIITAVIFALLVIVLIIVLIIRFMRMRKTQSLDNTTTESDISLL